MWKGRIFRARDAQGEPELCLCDRCGGEIYAYDRVGEVDGEYLHEGCLTEEEGAFCPMGQAIEFFEEMEIS